MAIIRNVRGGTVGLNEEERINALHLLIEKYSPNDKVIGNQYAQKSFHRTNRLFPVSMFCS